MQIKNTKWYKTIFSKKALYVLLFMALNLIEWLKATQDGDVWMVAVNCTGLVMMVMIVSACPVRELLNRFSGIWTGICVIAMAGVYIYWKCHVVPYILWRYLTGVMNIWWIGILVHYMIGQFRKGIRLSLIHI